MVRPPQRYTSQWNMHVYKIQVNAFPEYPIASGSLRHLGCRSQDESEDNSEEEDGNESESKDEDENEDRSDVDEIFLEDIIIKTIEMSKLSSGTLALYSRAFEMLVLGSLLLLYL